MNVIIKFEVNIWVLFVCVKLCFVDRFEYEMKLMVLGKL